MGAMPCPQAPQAATAYTTGVTAKAVQLKATGAKAQRHEGARRSGRLPGGGISAV